MVTGIQLVHVEGLTVDVATHEDADFVFVIVIVVGGNSTTSVVVDVTVDGSNDVIVDGAQVVVAE